MRLIDLPDDILIIIIKQLDIKSLYNLYSAYDRIRNIINSYGIIKTCNLSLNVMSSAATFKSIFFRDISRNLRELNISSMFDLNKTKLLTAVKRLSCLYKLDVTYTTITIFDLIEIYRVCPTIKDISINFSFYKSENSGRDKLKLEELCLCQTMFENFLNVHFVGNIFNLVHSQITCFILKKAKLKQLVFTINNHDSKCYDLDCQDIINFDTFFIYLKDNLMLNYVGMQTNCESKSYGCLDEMSSFRYDFQNYETIIIVRKYCFREPICYVSPVFEKFIRELCHVNTEITDLYIIKDFKVGLYGNACVMLWNKMSTKFDDKFFSDLRHKIRPFFPYYFEPSAKMPVSPQYDSYISYPKPITENKGDDSLRYKRRRVGLPSTVINYDTEFTANRKLQLTLLFTVDFKSAVSLSSSSEYLNKLTYLCLAGRVHYNPEFFNILFRCCHKLETLLVAAPFLSPCAAIARFLPLSCSIKNIHLVDIIFDFQPLFSAMSQCKTLENVLIMDSALNTKDISDPFDMFCKCENLYCLHIYGSFTETARKRNLQLLKQANINCQKHVDVKVLDSKFLYSHPYNDVFNLNILKHST